MEYPILRPDVDLIETNAGAIINKARENKFMFVTYTQFDVLRLCTGENSLEDIVNLISQKYEVSKERVKHDVQNFISFMHKKGVFIVTFIRVFAEFFQVVAVIPRWDHRLKDPESVAFTILDVLADFESEGKLKNLPKSKKFPVKTILAILLFKQYYNLPLRDAQHYGRKFFGANIHYSTLHNWEKKLNLEELTNHLLKKLQKLPYASTQADSTIITNKKRAG
ncbi:PqqD family protein [Thermococcus bergensis]|uniref:PqqD family protein n=2 Tax=Thermococcus TaxID=2263 RepID=UPI001CEC3BD4|nr:PqqD family protein [Thermococcus bergensis]MCA6213592.1 PqqD family protein [Thermococcus bergensis]